MELVKYVLISLFPDWLLNVAVALLSYFFLFLWKHGRQVLEDIGEILRLREFLSLVFLIAMSIWLNWEYMPVLMEGIAKFFMNAVEWCTALLIISIYTHRKNIISFITNPGVMAIAGVIILSLGSYAGYKLWIRTEEENKKDIPSVRKLINDAENGDPKSANRLGIMYQNGEIFRVNYDEAVFWYSKGCEKKYPPSLYNLGDMYYYGEGVKQNYAEALRLYEMSAEHFSLSQYSAGHMYLFGLGTKRDYKKAFDFLSKAAAQENIPAVHELGIMYYNGYGVKQDKRKALSLYVKAADNGLVDAQYNAGYAYEEGISNYIKPDYNRAYYYYFLAELGGNKEASRKIRSIESQERLTEEEIKSIKGEALRKFQMMKK